MFAEPTASRGKSKKGASDKRQVQRATKTQRKSAGLSRGADYEVEDIGGMYGCEGGVEVASEPEEETSSSSGEDTVERDGLRSTPPKSARSKVPQASLLVDAVDEDDDEEVREIKDGIREQLREWAADSGMPEDEQKRNVRQLLAQWHPDKNQHIRAVATRIFQFIQAEVNRIVSQFGIVSDTAARKQAEAIERKAQRVADSTAMASALKAARDEKTRRKGQSVGEEAPSRVQCDPDEEFSMVIGHGPATTSFLRPIPRSHFSLHASLVGARNNEVLLFGGEAYDGREQMFYSDLYRVDLKIVEHDRPLPWEKLYASVPTVPGPEARSAHQAVVWDKWLYIFGGEWSSRDHKRFRQFNDLWRIDVTAGPGTRWERLDAEGAPSSRSGHRMGATSCGQAVLFGGFNEDRRRRTTYLDDFYGLDLQRGAWHPIAADRRCKRPSTRSGHLLWVSENTTYVYGGSRTKKGSDKLDVLDDLWRARIEIKSGSACAQWEALVPQGQGPGRRSGLCQCPVSPESPGRRLVFGGVTDMRMESGQAQRSAKEVSFFHNDIFLLDCDSGASLVWTQLWPAPGSSVPMSLSSLIESSSMPAELLAKGGGVDVQTLVAITSETGGKAPVNGPQAPRGRLGAGCAVVNGGLWLFGGSCESGPRQEVTLDDLWWIDLKVNEDGVRCGDQWECILPLSEKATVWFDSDSDSDEEEEMEMEADEGARGKCNVSTLANMTNKPGTLSKKGQHAEAKKARMEVKREKQMEKCEEKLDKRELKKEKQRSQAQAKAQH